MSGPFGGAQGAGLLLLGNGGKRKKSGGGFSSLGESLAVL